MMKCMQIIPYFLPGQIQILSILVDFHLQNTGF